MAKRSLYICQTCNLPITEDPIIRQQRACCNCDNKIGNRAYLLNCSGFETHIISKQHANSLSELVKYFKLLITKRAEPNAPLTLEYCNELLEALGNEA